MSVEPLKNCRALVTGATGFIGAPLVRALIASGAKVEATSRRSPPDTTVSGAVLWRQVDLTDETAVNRLVEEVDPDVIFHLAGATSAARELDLVLPTFRANTSSTVHLLAGAARQRRRRQIDVAAGPRVIVAGSLEQPIVRADGTLAAPSSPYAASKHAAAAYAQMFCDLFDVPTVVARIFMVYGPGQTDLRKLVPYVTLSLLRDRAPKLSSGGRAVDWVYVDDVVASLLRMATAPGAVGRTIDVGSGVLTPVASVARSLGRLINTSTEPVFGEVPDRPGEQVRVADVAGAAEALGGDSTVTPLDDGLRRTIAWYADRLHSGTIDPATLP